MKLNLSWQDKMLFVASAAGCETKMDAKAPIGQGSALTPKELVLAGLSGCTAMDVIALMRKHKQKVTRFDVKTDASVSAGGHPVVFTAATLTFELDGEVVERLDPHIGLLHRGTEKLMESRTYLQNLPYFDRLDYCAPMNQEHALCLAIEKLCGTEIPRRASLIRVLYSEIGRVLNHLLNVTTQAMDVGALTPPASSAGLSKYISLTMRR